MKRLTTNKHKTALFFLSLFFVVWACLTIWLNIEHRKEIQLINKAHVLALKVTHTSDVLISSQLTGYPNIHDKAYHTYESQLKELAQLKSELNLLWPNTPVILTEAIEEAEVSFNDLKNNPESYTLHEKFSNANVYFENMSYHELSMAKRDILHQNLPLVLILAFIIFVATRFAEKLEFRLLFGKKLSPEIKG